MTILNPDKSTRARQEKHYQGSFLVHDRCNRIIKFNCEGETSAKKALEALIDIPVIKETKTGDAKSNSEVRSYSTNISLQVKAFVRDFRLKGFVWHISHSLGGATLQEVWLVDKRNGICNLELKFYKPDFITICEKTRPRECVLINLHFYPEGMSSKLKDDLKNACFRFNKALKYELETLRFIELSNAEKFGYKPLKQPPPVVAPPAEAEVTFSSTYTLFKAPPPMPITTVMKASKGQPPVKNR